jgi:copper chaperone
MTSATYQVTGMTCEHCVHALTEELQNLGSVTGVTVDPVPGGKSAVTVTSKAQLSRDAVAAALDEAGDYQLAGTETPEWPAPEPGRPWAACGPAAVRPDDFLPDGRCLAQQRNGKG